MFRPPSIEQKAPTGGAFLICESDEVESHESVDPTYHQLKWTASDAPGEGRVVFAAPPAWEGRNGGEEWNEIRTSSSRGRCELRGGPPFSSPFIPEAGEGTT